MQKKKKNQPPGQFLLNDLKWKKISLSFVPKQNKSIFRHVPSFLSLMKMIIIVNRALVDQIH